MRKQLHTVWLATLLISLQTFGQTADDEAEAESGPVYQVEVLVFRNVDQSRTTAEISRLVEPEIDDVLDQQLARLTVTDSRSELTTDNPTDEDFWELANRDQLVMRADADRLDRLPAYELIGHFAWLQAADDVAVAREIMTADLDRGAGVSGTFKLYRKRYLHLAVDLALGEARDTLRDGSRGGFGQLLPVQEASPAIVDSRRMRLGRTVYFDQPEFGVLARVEKMEFDESEWSRTAARRR